jgi:hypothetical protein
MVDSPGTRNANGSFKRRSLWDFISESVYKGEHRSCCARR